MSPSLVFGYLLSRLAEQSTWRGMVWIAVSLGLIPAEAQDQTMQYVIKILQGATALVGVISVLFPDCSNWITLSLGYDPKRLPGSAPAPLPPTPSYGQPQQPGPPPFEPPPHNGFGDK